MPRPTRRQNTTALTFRKRIPADLRDVAKGQAVRIVFPAHGHEPEHVVTATLGAAEVTFSLRTRDPRIATARSGIAEDHLQRLFAGLRSIREGGGPVRLTARQAHALAGAWYRRFVSSLEDNPGTPIVWECFLKTLAPEAVLKLDHPRRGLLITPDALFLREAMAPHVAEVLAEHAIPEVDAGSEDTLSAAMWQALQDAGATLQRRAKGDYGPDKAAERFPSIDALPPTPRPSTAAGQPASPSPANTGRASSRATLTGLVDGWGKERQPRAKTLTEAVRVVGAFVKQVGHDDAARITPEDVVAWKDSLVASGKLSAKTINTKYLTPLGTVLNWATANRRIASNPAQGVRSSGKAPPRVRERSFTSEEAATILKAAAFAPDAPGKHSAETVAARRWAPWICAYTGARVGEITQLRGQDIQQVDGVWTFHISPAAGSVKIDKPRRIPIHSDLIRQGLLEFVAKRGGGPLFYREEAHRLRPPATRKAGQAGRASRTSATDKPAAHPSEAPAKALARWVRDIGVMDPNVQPNHGWRHLFITLCRTHGIGEEARYFMVGHTRRDMGQHYGEASVKALAAELEKLPAFLPTTAVSTTRGEA